VVTSHDSPSCRKSAGNFRVWTARERAGSSTVARSGSSVSEGCGRLADASMISTLHVKADEVCDPRISRDPGNPESFASDQARK